MIPASPYGPLLLDASARDRRHGDRYFIGLGVVLLGYALFSRPFAYIGVPPLYIGEIVLLAGLWVAWRSGALRTALALWPVRLLVAFMLWGAVCTLPYLGTYGVDALRDAVLWGYGLFGIVVATLVARHPERLRDLLLQYRHFVWAFLALIGTVYVLNSQLAHLVPRFPGNPHVPLIEAKGGDILVHLAGVTAFLVVGMMRLKWPLVLLLTTNLGLVLIANRGGMVAYAVAGLVLLAMKPRRRSVVPLAAGFTFLLLLFLLAGSLLTIKSGREVSAEQLWTNIQSVAGSADGKLEGTKRWRLEWWGKIVDYTFAGPYFLTGKGFGINLATDDGFQVDRRGLLRSPHNGHLTVLARMGVPGLALWLLMHAAWLAVMLGAWLQARRRGDEAWMGIFTFLVAYWLASMVNATFDVYLEGPPGGIWMWCLWGLGLGAVHVFRHRPEVVHDRPLPAAPRPPRDAASRRDPQRPSGTETPAESLALA